MTRLPDDVALSLRTCGWCGRRAYDLHPDGDGGWQCAVQVGCAATSKRRPRVRATALPGGQRGRDGSAPSTVPAVHQGAQRGARR